MSSNTLDETSHAKRDFIYTDMYCTKADEASNKIPHIQAAREILRRERKPMGESTREPTAHTEPLVSGARHWLIGWIGGGRSGVRAALQLHHVVDNLPVTKLHEGQARSVCNMMLYSQS